MIGASFDRSKLLPLYARIGEAGVPIIFKFRDANGNPVDISTLDFELPIWLKPSDEENGTDPKFTLTIGDGLTVQGVGNGDLKAEITQARAKQRNDTYFYKLRETNADHTWLNGPFRFHNGEFDGVNESFSITNDMDVTITMGIGSSDIGAVHYQGVCDLSADLFPTVGGSGAVGAIAKGDEFDISVAGTPGGGDLIPAGSTIRAKVNLPGQVLANWRIYY